MGLFIESVDMSVRHHVSWTCYSKLDWVVVVEVIELDIYSLLSFYNWHVVCVADAKHIRENMEHFENCVSGQKEQRQKLKHIISNAQAHVATNNGPFEFIEVEVQCTRVQTSGNRGNYYYWFGTKTTERCGSIFCWFQWK